MEKLIEDFENDFVDAGAPIRHGRRVKILRPIIGKSPVVLSKETGIPGRPTLLIKRQNHVGFFKKIGRGIGKAAKAVGKGTAKFVKATVIKPTKAITKGTLKVIKKVTTGSVLLPLLPFKGAMQKALRKKGLTPPSKMEDLAKMFHKVIVQKKSNLSDDVAPIVAIIPPIISFIKSLVTRKKEGAPLTPDEQELATEGERVITEVAKTVTKSGGLRTVADPELSEAQDKAVSMSKESAAQELGIKNDDGTINFKNPWIIGGLAAAFIIIVLLATRK